MNKPIIQIFKTINQYYLLDGVKCEILPISEKSFLYLNDVLNEKDEYNESNLPTEELTGLYNNGYLSTKSNVEKVQHVYTEYLPYFLQRKIDKITLQVTQKCNFRCKYCVYSEKTNKMQRSHSQESMTLETAKKSIDFLLSHSIDNKEINVSFLEVLLQVYINLRSLGLKVSLYTKSPLSLGTNFHCISTLFEGSSNEKTKIVSLKTTIKEIEHLEQPDIILIEAPDPIMEYNEFAHNGYGIRTYMLSLALIPDSIICVIPTELAINDYVEAVGKFVKEKYNAELDGIHASNAVIDSLEVIQSQRLSWVHIPLEEVDKNLQKNQQPKIPIINVLHNGANLITDTILNRLSYKEMNPYDERRINQGFIENFRK